MLGEHIALFGMAVGVGELVGSIVLGMIIKLLSIFHFKAYFQIQRILATL